MKKLEEIKFVAENGGRFIVYMDGVEMSQHNEIYKAQEKVVNLQILNPDSSIHIQQFLKINAMAKFTDDSNDTLSEASVYFSAL